MTVLAFYPFSLHSLGRFAFNGSPACCGGWAVWRCRSSREPPFGAKPAILAETACDLDAHRYLNTRSNFP